MALVQDGSGDDRNPSDLYRRLAAATPAERAEMVLRAIEAHPEGRLELPAREGTEAILDEINLGRRALQARRAAFEGLAPWWDDARKAVNLRSADLRGARLRGAVLRGGDLNGADLRGAVLGGADLRGCLLEGASLQDADLAGARLARAALGKADLRNALLEEADLSAATLRFADLRGSALEQATLGRADLWNVNLEDAVLAGAGLRHANLREANLRRADLSKADLRRASLGKADLRDATLTGADLRGASLTGANLCGAVLKDARLEGLDLSHSEIARIHLGGAYLERTRLRQDQLGDAIGEELIHEYESAARGYLALEQNFAGLGDIDASSWSYRRRRRMQKLASRQRARHALGSRRWREAALFAIRYANDQVVEWLCDYGESIPRVLATMLVVYLLFTLIYGLTGSVVRVEETRGGPLRVPTKSPLDLAIFSLLAMTTSGSPAVGLEPRSEAVHLLTGFQASLGIALTGLLGFVLGNRVRR